MFEWVFTMGLMGASGYWIFELHIVFDNEMIFSVVTEIKIQESPIAIEIQRDYNCFDLYFYGWFLDFVLFFFSKTYSDLFLLVSLYYLVEFLWCYQIYLCSLQKWHYLSELFVWILFLCFCVCLQTLFAKTLIFPVRSIKEDVNTLV